ncbi:HAD-IA family hydrolase [Galbibacter sp. PAP.153]|uniref:HAD-IA family hydrolase n=1 Tax=Galbibacter sp. PAP.153 TaxID=3104623 RepID=UPI00300BCEB1
MIQNIIFDFGDIFIDLEKAASLNLILEKYPDFKLSEEIIQLNNQYEMGLLSTDAFIAAYQKFLPKENKTGLKNIWNSIILHIPEHRMEFIETLANENKFRLFLLSNTNDLHIEQVIKNITPANYERLKNCFEKFYLSHEINLRKPNKDIFEFVLEQNKLIAQETLFIDDTAENIETAKKIGLHTWHLIPGKEDIASLFKKDFPFS